MERRKNFFLKIPIKGFCEMNRKQFDETRSHLPRFFFANRSRCQENLLFMSTIYGNFKSEK